MKSFAQIAATNIVIGALGAVTGVLVAFALGPEGRGQLAEIMVWPQILAGLLLFSLNEVATVRVARSPADFSVRTLWWILGAWIPAMLLVGLGVLAIVGLIRPGFDLAGAGTYFALFLPLNFIGVSLLGVLTGANCYLSHSLLRILHPCAYIVGVMSLWAVGSENVFGYASAELVASLAVAIVCIVVTKALFIDQSNTLARVRDWLGQAASFHRATAVSLLNMHAHRLLIVVLASREIIGEYLVAHTLVYSLMWAWSSATGIVTLADVARLESDPDRDAYTSRAIYMTLLGLIPACVFVWLTAEWFFLSVLGTEFDQAGRISAWLSIALIPQMILHVISRASKARDRISPSIRAETIGLIVFCATLLGLWTRLGVYAAVVAFGLSGLVALVAYRLAAQPRR